MEEIKKNEIEKSSVSESSPDGVDNKPKEELNVKNSTNLDDFNERLKTLHSDALSKVTKVIQEKESLFVKEEKSIGDDGSYLMKQVVQLQESLQHLKAENQQLLESIRREYENEIEKMQELAREYVKERLQQK